MLPYADLPRHNNSIRSHPPTNIMHISNSCDEKNRIGWPIVYNPLHYYRTENLQHYVFIKNAAIVFSRIALLAHIAILPTSQWFNKDLIIT